jgi:hypothetical protein
VIIVAASIIALVVVVAIVIGYRCRAKSRTIFIKPPNTFSPIYPYIPQSVIKDVVGIEQDDDWEVPRDK